MTFQKFVIAVTLSLSLSAAAFAQRGRSDVSKSKSHSAPTITVSPSSKGLRFTMLGGAKQMRLEVFDADGDALYSSDFQPGNVRDWKLEDRRGQPLPDGTYLCVVTFRDVPGRVGMKQGHIVIQGGRAALRLDDDAQPDAREDENALAPVTGDGATAVTVIAHDGADGQLVTTRGGLSFRAGDFFSAQDKELMRLTPEGDLGLGVASPQAKLDVAGAILARGGIRFDDGTTMTTAPADRPTANAAGTGTTGRLAKWLETGGAGTLGDSSVFESGGLVGVGTTAPEGTLHIQTPDTTVFKVVSTGTVATGRAIFQMYRGAAATANGWDFGYNTDLSTQNFIIRELTNGAPAARFSLAKGTGNVGIGTATPQSRLHVAGDIKVTGNAVVDGNIAAKYQDVAEWVPARGELAAGTVVVLDRARSNAVEPSRRAYSTHVAGGGLGAAGADPGRGRRGESAGGDDRTSEGAGGGAARRRSHRRPVGDERQRRGGDEVAARARGGRFAAPARDAHREGVGASGQRRGRDTRPPQPAMKPGTESYRKALAAIGKYDVN